MTTALPTPIPALVLASFVQAALILHAAVASAGTTDVTDAVCLQGPEHVVGGRTLAAGPPRPAGEGPTIVDVMVVYTPSARSALGGHDGALATIESHVAYTNAAYERSGVHHRIRLVHAGEIDYVESGSILTDLDRLRAPGDGFLDDVHDMRDAWGADLVSLISTSAGAGVAYRMFVLDESFAADAFSVLNAASGGLVFAHETGHNMGCAHNNGDPGPTIFCYSYGYRLPDDEFDTIMSNPPGEHLDYFSSPDLEFEGEPLGVTGDGCPPDAADNVRSLNNAAATVANFRPTVVPPPCPADLDASGAVDFGDILVVLGQWGNAGGPADLDGSGVVDFGDLLVVLGRWGACPA